jgi:hypothetical protein
VMEIKGWGCVFLVLRPNRRRVPITERLGSGF